MSRRSFRRIAASPGLCLLALLALVSCGDTGEPGEGRVPVFVGDDVDRDLDLDGWRLVWNDEFDGPAGTGMDTTKWVADIGIGPNGDGWGNQQLEYNTDRPENASVDGEGVLEIRALREGFGGRNYTSARWTTIGRFSQQYGRVEARIQLPEGQGLWPAFWMLGTDISSVGWPQCGEIDIMEFRGNEVNRALGTIHGPGYSGGNAVGGETIAREGLVDDFHTFTIDWDPNLIVWYLDGVEYFRATPDTVPFNREWVFDQPFFLIINLAVGGNFLENPDDSTPFPAVMRVDYVRVYERAE